MMYHIGGQTSNWIFSQSSYDEVPWTEILPVFIDKGEVVDHEMASDCLDSKSLKDTSTTLLE